MKRRFLIPRGTSTGALVSLSPEESHHLKNVLRLKRGERLTLFDGVDRSYEGVVCSTDASGVVVEVGEVIPSTESLKKVFLAQALLKTDKMELVLQKAMELGVFSFHPFATTRTIIPLEKADRSDRWKKIVEGAAKQSGNSRILQVSAPLKFSEILKIKADLKILFWEESTDPLKAFLEGELQRLSLANSVLIVIGPEGGFSVNEVEQAKESGCVILSLGQHILRAETAAVLATGLIQYEWQNL